MSENLFRKFDWNNVLKLDLIGILFVRVADENEIVNGK